MPRDRSRLLPETAITRRSVFGIAGATAGMVLATRSFGVEPAASELPVLKEGDHVPLDTDLATIVQRAYQLGHDYEKEHGGCARCTVAALQDALPMVSDEEGLFRAATCLDGGATPVAVHSCGGFTGAGIVIGFLCGSRRNETFHGSAKLAHHLLHQVYHRYAKEYGTVLCRDVRKKMDGNCPEVVGRAARWTAEILLAEFCGLKLEEEIHGPVGK